MISRDDAPPYTNIFSDVEELTHPVEPQLTIAMANKRKRSHRPPAIPEPKETKVSDGKLKHLTTYEDIADSEDEFFINKDKILLDGVAAGRASHGKMNL